MRVGLVGYGDAGRGIHARLLREVGHVVVGVVTRHPDRVAAARDDWPGVTVHADLAGLLAAGGLDLVVVASPTGRHVEHALDVVASGVPVVVDKPLGTDAAGAAQVVRAARDAGARLTVFQNRRWDSEQGTLRDLLERDELGRVHRFERRWERWRPVPKDRWKENAVGDGGGLLLDLGAHLVDSAVELFGPVETVRAELRSLTTPTEDDVFLALDHASGTISHLWASGLTGAPGPRTRVLGDKGAYLVTAFEGEPTPFEAVMDPGAGHTGWLVHGADAVPVPTAPGTHADFYRSVEQWLRGGPVPVDPIDAVATGAVLDAARSSAARGSAPVRPEPVENLLSG